MPYFPPHDNPQTGLATQAHTFFVCTEVFLVVAEHCCWSTLVSLGHVDKRTRFLVRQCLRSRVRYFLGLFIPPSEHIDLMGMLKIIRGVMMGPLVWCMMSTDVPVYHTVNPRQLDIVVGANSSYPMLHRFFQRLGYSYRQPFHRKPNMAVGIKKYYRSFMVCVISWFRTGD